MDDPPAGRSAREDHADSEARLMQLGSGFELDPGVRNEERDRSLAENVDLQILDLLRKYLLHMFGEGRHIALNGGPAVGWLLHFLRDVDQRLVLRIPDGRNLPWIQLEKALAVGLDQTGDCAPSLILVRLGPHHEPPGLLYRHHVGRACSIWRSLLTASVVPARPRSKGPMRPHLQHSSDHVYSGYFICSVWSDSTERCAGSEWSISSNTAGRRWSPISGRSRSRSS